jgi:hypothetical protein
MCYPPGKIPEPYLKLGQEIKRHPETEFGQTAPFVLLLVALSFTL